MPLPSDGFAVGTERSADVIVLALVGELDLSTAPLVREALIASETEPVQRLVVDLSRLTFIDSSGLHVFVEAHERLRRGRSPRLEICGASLSVRRVFEVTGVDARLPFDAPSACG